MPIYIYIFIFIYPLKDAESALDMIKRKREERRRTKSSCTSETDSEAPRSGQTLTPADRRQKAREERELMLADREQRRESARTLRAKEDADNAARKRRSSIKDGTATRSGSDEEKVEIVIKPESIIFDDRQDHDVVDDELYNPYTGRRRSIPKSSPNPSLPSSPKLHKDLLQRLEEAEGITVTVVLLYYNCRIV